MCRLNFESLGFGFYVLDTHYIIAAKVQSQSHTHPAGSPNLDQCFGLNTILQSLIKKCCILEAAAIEFLSTM